MSEEDDLMIRGESELKKRVGEPGFESLTYLVGALKMLTGESIGEAIKKNPSVISAFMISESIANNSEKDRLYRQQEFFVRERQVEALERIAFLLGKIVNKKGGK